MIGNLMVVLEPYISAVAMILIHSLWQGAIIGILTAIALFLLKSGSARIRYTISCGAMASVIAITAITAVSVSLKDGNTSKNIPAVTLITNNTVINSEISERIDTSPPVNDDSSPDRWWQRPSINSYVFMIWIVGVLLISIYHILGWRRARHFTRENISPVPIEWQSRLKELCADLGISRFVAFLGSSLVKVPCVVGWVRPVILVPVSMFTSLNPSEIEMILMHELAHVRRFDVLVNIIQTTMETLFFFNPAIWWLSRQIRIERENCCDDEAIIKSGDRMRYARALTNLEELKLTQSGLGTALTGTGLRHRIQRIVGVNKPHFYSSIFGISGMLLSVSIIMAILGAPGGSTNSVAQAAEVTQTFKADPGDLQGEWETEWDGHQLKILVYGRQSSGMSYILNRDEVTDLIGRGEKPFEIVRDAGTLFLEGNLEERRGHWDGSGIWYFRPDTAYMRYMTRYGLGEDDRQKTFSLAIRDISRKYLAGMEERGYHGLTIDQLISAGVFGISPELVDEYRLIGYPDLTYQQLLSMQVQRVTPNEARRFEKTGIGHPTPELLVSARINGVTPEYVASFRKAGFLDLTLKNFITLRAFNIDVDKFKDCYRHRFMDLSQENMVWVCGFGITKKDIEKMKKRGLTDMDSIIRALAEDYGK